MKNVNSAPAPKGILKSILFVMLVLVATFNFVSCVDSSPRSNEIGKDEYQEIPSSVLNNQSQIGTSAFAIGGRNISGDIGGRSTSSGDYFTPDTGVRNSIVASENNNFVAFDTGGRGNELGAGYAFAIGGRNGNSSGEHLNTDIGGRNTSSQGENCNSKSLYYEHS